MDAAGSSSDGVGVCLIGPTTSGKSHLLLALMAGTKDRMHGFPESFELRVELTDRQVRSAASPSERMKMILTHRAGTAYDDHVSDAVSQALDATQTSDIRKYEFELTYGNGATRTRFDFTVADAAGEHIFPEGTQGDATTRESFIDYLVQSEGLVIVLPFYRIRRSRFDELMDRLIDALTPDDTLPGEAPRLKRVIIALSQYERLFVQFGNQAAEIASHPHVARQAAASRLRDVAWMRRLRELRRRYDIKVIVTSAYGFLPDFGNPNLDPDAEPNLPFAIRVDPDNPANSEYERHPFLAADPFIFAASGLDNQFMLDIEEVFRDGGENGGGDGGDGEIVEPESRIVFALRRVARKIERFVRRFFEL
jgi:hypothetical protein